MTGNCIFGCGQNMTFVDSWDLGNIFWYFTDQNNYSDNIENGPLQPYTQPHLSVNSSPWFPLLFNAL